MEDVESIIQQWQSRNPGEIQSELEIKSADPQLGIYAIYFKQEGRNRRIKALRQESSGDWLLIEQS